MNKLKFINTTRDLTEAYTKLVPPYIQPFYIVAVFQAKSACAALNLASILLASICTLIVEYLAFGQLKLPCISHFDGILGGNCVPPVRMC